MRFTKQFLLVIFPLILIVLVAKADDLEKLAGTWQLMEMQINGNSNTKDAAKYKWVFADGKYTILQNDKKAEVWEVKLSGRSIDSKHHITDRIHGRSLTGIYELSGDTLKVCYDLEGKSRPDDFQTTPGSRRVLYVLQRK